MSIHEITSEELYELHRTIEDYRILFQNHYQHIWENGTLNQRESESTRGKRLQGAESILRIIRFDRKVLTRG